MKRLIFPLIILIAYLTSCKSTECEKPLNPNGDSELALLMREMYDEGQSFKTAILNDDKIESILKHEKMLTAQATQPEKAESDLYKAFAGNYLQLIKELKDPENLDREASYKNMVNSCINCHQALCPGPIMRINKLKI